MKYSQVLLLVITVFVVITLTVNIRFISSVKKSNATKEALIGVPSRVSISSAKQQFSVKKQTPATGDKDDNNNNKDDDDDDDDSNGDDKKVENGNSLVGTGEVKSSLTANKDHSETTAGWKLNVTAGNIPTEKPTTDYATEQRKTITAETKGDPSIAVAQYKNETVEQIHLLLPPSEIEWIRKRTKRFNDFYNTDRETRNRYRQEAKAANDPERYDYNATTGFTKYQMDKEGPWLDFIIAGHPKTGTTTLVANLANIAPMKVKDFCISSMHGLLKYTYNKWPEKFPEIMEKPDQYIPDRTLQLKGSKCPRFISDASLILEFSYAYPRTKLIIGIRHPILWLTSFINMGPVGDLYTRMTICPYYHDINPITGFADRARNSGADPSKEICVGECRCGLPVCFHRARLHLPLARVGKTPLSTKEERDLLSPGDPDGGENLFNGKLRNPIFVYDQTQMKEDSYWDELADFLGVSHIPNAHYHAAHGKGTNKTICTKYYDEYRSKLMAHSYNMSVWLEEYFLPVAVDPNRPDVVVANPESLRAAIETYKHDPCSRLVRRESDGEYILDPSLGEVQEDGVTPAVLVVYSTEKAQCTPHYPPTPEEKERRLEQKKYRASKALAAKEMEEIWRNKESTKKGRNLEI
eukprot:jgi/Psemu1/32202/gm1.32202_g